MIKILEIKETLFDSQLVKDIYELNQLTKQMINKIESIEDINYDDFKYLQILLEKTKIGLKKANEILKLQY